MRLGHRLHHLSAAATSALQDRDHVAFAHDVVLRHLNLHQPAADGRGHRDLHLHRFEDEDRIVGGQRIADFGLNLPHLSGDVAPNLGGRHPLPPLTHPDCRQRDHARFEKVWPDRHR